MTERIEPLTTDDTKSTAFTSGKSYLELLFPENRIHKI